MRLLNGEICGPAAIRISLLLVFLEAFLRKGVSSEGPPKKISASVSKRIIFAQANSQVLLACPIEATEDNLYFDWFKANESLYLHKNFDITIEGELKIASVAKKHQGTYTCEAVNGYGVARVNVTLIVDNPESENFTYTSTNINPANRVQTTPPVIKKRSSSTIVEDIGGESTLHCIATGTPTPHIYWMKDGRLLDESGRTLLKSRVYSTLRIKNIKKSDVGTYKCIARNSAGIDELEFKLELNKESSAPKIVALIPNSETAREGTTVHFVCEIESKPGRSVHIKWLKKVTEAESGDSLFRAGSSFYRPLNFTESASTSGLIKSKLIIRNTGIIDSGIYVCLALNDRGYNFKNASLKIISRATIVGTSNMPANNIPLIVSVSIGIVFLLGTAIIVAQLICKGQFTNKPVERITSVQNIEAGSIEKSISSIPRQNGNSCFEPDITDPQSTKKLLISI